MRLRLALLAILGSGVGHVASAQPLDPYAAPVAPPAADDPVLAEQVAQALTHRAQELFDARVFVDARQLAVEALAKSPSGAAAEHARYLIKTIDRQLGVRDPAGGPTSSATGAELDAQVDKTPFGDRVPVPPPVEPEGPGLDTRRAAVRVHAGIYLGGVGAMIGSWFSDAHPAAGAVPVGLVAAAAGAAFAPRLVGQRFSEAQIRTVGAGSVWGGLIGGLVADAAKVDGTTARHVLIGTTVGSTIGVLGGAALARRGSLTRGDVALIDTLAGAGAVGGLTLGMLMQPAEGEAYAVNSILGAVGGVVVGLVAAPQTNTTPRRMMRVAGVAAIGGAAPFLMYAAIADSTTQADERAVGALSTAGLVAGLFVGFRLTRTLDVDLDVEGPDRGARSADDAPAALIGRSSDGRWALGPLAVMPLSPSLAPQAGLSIPLVGGALR